MRVDLHAYVRDYTLARVREQVGAQEAEQRLGGEYAYEQDGEVYLFAMARYTADGALDIPIYGHIVVAHPA